MRSGIVIIALFFCGLTTFHHLRGFHSRSDAVEPKQRQSVIAPHHRTAGEATPSEHLESWAARDPRAALHWLSSQDRKTQTTRAREAWHGAIHQPDLALEIGGEFLHSQPADLAALHGLWLTHFLADVGMADRAMDFALQAPEAIRREWLPGLLAKEAARSPQSATTLWQRLPAGDEKQNAWKPILTAWSSQDAAGLCAHAIALPPTTPERAESLREGTNAWCMSDPTAYTKWLNTVGSQDDFNNGLALLIVRTDSLFRAPTDALGWTASITDPDLRLICAAQVLKQWAADQPDQAKSWIDHATWLDDTQRADLLQASFHRGFVPED